MTTRLPNVLPLISLNLVSPRQPAIDVLAQRLWQFDKVDWRGALVGAALVEDY